MAVSLGKRKRHDQSSRRREEEKEDESPDEENLLRARFQRAFEAKFKPLKELQRMTKQKISNPSSVGEEEEEEDVGLSDDESGWSGLSDDEGDDDHGEQVEIVEHGSEGVDADIIGTREKKAFMSSKPPTSADQALKSTRANNHQTPKTEDNDTDPSETANLKNDLALQRLLKESHLLDASTFAISSSSSSTLPTGKSRLKALDLRIQDLGGSSGKQPPAVKMSMALRKGLKAKATRREDKRRKEAAENGIILERAITSSTSAGSGTAKKKRRERAIGTPNVGRFQGGTLRLSSKDVRSIEGPKERVMGGKKRARRR